METEALDWESSLLSTKRNNQIVLIITTILSLLIALASVIAVVVILPLKTIEPFVAMVDKDDGSMSIIRSVDVMPTTYNEVITKYWLVRYVQEREGYDFYTITNNYHSVLNLSSPDVGAEYSNLYEGDNAIQTVLGSNKRIDIEIISVSITNEHLGQVRFIKKTKINGEKNYLSSKKYVVNIGYEYIPIKKTNDKIRLINPMGFYAFSYVLSEELNYE